MYFTCFNPQPDIRLAFFTMRDRSQPPYSYV